MGSEGYDPSTLGCKPNDLPINLTALVGTDWFEQSTSHVSGECFHQLSYVPKKLFIMSISSTSMLIYSLSKIKLAERTGYDPAHLFQGYQFSRLGPAPYWGQPLLLGTKKNWTSVWKVATSRLKPLGHCAKTDGLRFERRRVLPLSGSSRVLYQLSYPSIKRWNYYNYLSPSPYLSPFCGWLMCFRATGIEPALW